MAIEKALYTAHATSTGGRAGTSRTPDGTLELTLSTPKEMGGAGGPGTNPEQLFAAGLSIGPLAGGSFGFGIAVKLAITVPGMERAEAEKLVEAAHQVCPYSNATRGNVDVQLTVV